MGRRLRDAIDAPHGANHHLLYAICRLHTDAHRQKVSGDMDCGLSQIVTKEDHG